MFYNLQMTQQFCHEKNEQCFEAKAKKILMETEQYMKQNKLTLNEGKTEIMVFKNEKLPTVNCVEFNYDSLKPTDEVIYLGVILDKELTYQNNLIMWSVNGFSYQINLFGTQSNTFKGSNKSL